MKRYRPYYFDPVKVTGHDATMRENSAGDWVGFEDHEAEIRRLKQQFSLAEEGLANYQQENERLKADLEIKLAARNKWMRDAVERSAEINRLRTALRYWLPDETMIPAGHEVAWNEHVELIPEHRSAEPQPAEQA